MGGHGAAPIPPPLLPPSSVATVATTSEYTVPTRPTTVVELALVDMLAPTDSAVLALEGAITVCSPPPGSAPELPDGNTGTSSGIPPLPLTASSTCLDVSEYSVLASPQLSLCTRAPAPHACA
jgi:hypothetical protein